MDQTTFRILDKLSSNLGRDYSILSLTNELSGKDHKAYYKNIFDKIKELYKAGDIILKKIGNSSIISINFNNYDAVNLLSQLELMKQRQLLEKDAELKMVLCELSGLFRLNFCYINSISVIRPEKNKALNRQEFLFILKEFGKNNDQAVKEEIIGIHRIMKALANMHNMKLDCLILREAEFAQLLNEGAHNPLKEMISSQTVLTYGENYWLEIMKLSNEGIPISGAGEINPAKIDESEVIYNLALFGYKELGGAIEKGRDYCMETIIISLFLSEDARRMEAIPIILNKNLERGRKIIFNLLIFLALKYGKERKLLGYLQYLNDHKKNDELANAIALMTCIGIKPEKIDKKSIKQKLELYHGN